MNVLQYMPTASLMTYVMGLEAAKSRPATAAERKEMQRLLHEGMDAGLCGFSIQRLGPNSVQADFDGTPMVTDTMIDDDIFGLAEVLRERDEGFIQLTQATSPNPNDPERPGLQAAPGRGGPAADPRQRGTGQPEEPTHPPGAPRVDGRRPGQEGLRIFAQAATIRTGFAFSLDNWNLYDQSPAWREATTGTLEDKMRKMRDPALRERLRRETDEAATLFKQTQNAVGGPPRKLVVQHIAGRPDLNDRYEGKSLGQIAEEEGKDYIDVMLDLSLETNLKTEFLGEGPTFNIDHMAGVYKESPYTIPGVSDGGAHTKFFTGGAWTTDLLAWMVRDTKALTLEEAHYRMSALAAHAAGFKDRASSARAPRPTCSSTTSTSWPSIRPGSASRSTTCPVASGAVSRRRTATATSWSTASRPSPTASAPAPHPASCCATATPDVSSEPAEHLLS